MQWELKCPAFLIEKLYCKAFPKSEDYSCTTLQNLKKKKKSLGKSTFLSLWVRGLLLRSVKIKNILKDFEKCPMDKWRDLSWTLKTEYPNPVYIPCAASTHSGAPWSCPGRWARTPGCEIGFATRFCDDPYRAQWYFNRASGAKGGRVKGPWDCGAHSRPMVFIDIATNLNLPFS